MDDDEVENEGNRERKTPSSSSSSSSKAWWFIEQSTFGKQKRKTKQKKGTLSAPRSNKTGVPRKTHHERLVKRVEHL